MKARSTSKIRALQATLSTDLMCGDHEIGLIILHQVPRVRGELVFELSDEPFGSVEAHACIAAETDAQQVVEAGEMVHVCMRDEEITHSQELTGRQIRNVADVKQDGA